MRLARLVLIAALLALTPARALAQDTCLMVSAENIVRGEGNFYLYVEIADAAYTFAPGDQLEYDILLPALNPVLRGGVDADLDEGNLPTEFAGRSALRDCGLRDQGGIALHGNGLLNPARDGWYHRQFDVSKLAGAKAVRWTAVFEGDQPGRYVQFLDNIRIVRDGKPVFSIYEDGPAPLIEVRLVNGYSRDVLITAASRDGTTENDAVAAVLAKARRENELRVERDRLRAEIDIAGELAKVLRDERLKAQVDKAAAVEEAAPVDPEDPEGYLAALRRAREPLLRFQPALAGFTGHVVGHAHIDLQWLWGWDETVNQIIPDTFGQAVKFMQEFPEFTFSQSSAALYLAAEQHHPELFRQIQRYEKEGRWEIVGGRWCEGDLNMISPESHVRHFLYGQRYFQQKFGHICADAWEPDTFGHPWTMPQILRKAGIRSYYFCRGGGGSAGRPIHQEPLFWWKGPDGSKVLAFNEPPTGGWYIDVVNDNKVRELTKFAAATGAHDHLMVYGVGNHGGGPTRENIEAALAMKGRPAWPTVKFSTLAAFFDRLCDQVDHLRIPTVDAELNPEFEGCYTSHGRIKRDNRDSEVLLTSAEVFATLASIQSGRAGYPREEFERLWRDVLWNHHHDTLCGSCVHDSALYAQKKYEKVLARGREILERSQRALAACIGPARDSFCHVVVFNPLPWKRTEVTEVLVSHPAMRGGAFVLSDEEGEVPIQSQGPVGRGAEKLWFLARDVPGCGFKVFTVSLRGPDRDPPAPRPSSARPIVDAEFQVLHEKPRGMSAWTLGEIETTTTLKPVSEAVVMESGPLRRCVRTTYAYGESRIVQNVITYSHTGRIDYETTVDWQQVGNARDGSDMLKVAFDTGIRAETATYEIPFGDISRANDGHENVALKWCDLTGRGHPHAPAGRQPEETPEHGVTILNDCKHAYDVKDGLIRLTLLRSSYEPDPAPDVGVHRMRYASVWHPGPLDKAAAARAAREFNAPLQVLVIRPRGEVGAPSADLGTAWSGCSVEPANVILTCLKRAEDNDDFIIRAYECAGQAVSATFALGFEVKSATETDLLEGDMKDARRVAVDGRILTAEFKPYEIRTFRLRP